MITKKLFLISFVLWLQIITITTLAQSDQRLQLWGIPKQPTNCETNAANMEQVLSLMKYKPNPYGNIILIARLGRGETRRELNRRRLYNVSKRYQTTLNVPAEKIITTEGERTNDFGRIEIYWNGELIGAMPVGTNRDICVECCGTFEQYYPEKDETDRKAKLKRKRDINAP